MQTAKMNSQTDPASISFDREFDELKFRYSYSTRPTAESSAYNPPQILGTGEARVDMRKPGAGRPVWRWRKYDLDEFLETRLVRPGERNPFAVQ